MDFVTLKISAAEIVGPFCKMLLSCYAKEFLVYHCAVLPNEKLYLERSQYELTAFVFGFVRCI